MAALNQTYLAIHNIVKKGSTFEAKLRKALEDLERGKESHKKMREDMVAAKVALEEELIKVKVRNMELKG